MWQWRKLSRVSNRLGDSTKADVSGVLFKERPALHFSLKKRLLKIDLYWWLFYRRLCIWLTSRLFCCSAMVFPLHFYRIRNTFVILNSLRRSPILMIRMRIIQILSNYYPQFHHHLIDAGVGEGIGKKSAIINQEEKKRKTVGWVKNEARKGQP